MRRLPKVLVRVASSAKPAVVCFEQRLARQPDLVEGGEAVVDGCAGPVGQPPHLDSRQQAAFVAQRRQEQEHALVLAVDQETGGDHRGLGTARGAGVGHELLGAGMRCVEDELAGLTVEFGGCLQAGAVVAVVDFRAQERSDAAHGREIGEVAARVGVVVQEAAQEQVVVDARHRAQAPAAVHDRGPLVQVRQQVRVPGEALGVFDGVVHQS